MSRVKYVVTLKFIALVKQCGKDLDLCTVLNKASTCVGLLLSLVSIPYSTKFSAIPKFLEKEIEDSG